MWSIYATQSKANEGGILWEQASKKTIKKQNNKVRKNWYDYIVRESSSILTNLRLDLETKLAYAKRKRDGWIHEYQAAQDRLIRAREYLREHNPGFEEEYTKAKEHLDNALHVLVRKRYEIQEKIQKNKGKATRYQESIDALTDFTAEKRMMERLTTKDYAFVNNIGIATDACKQVENWESKAKVLNLWLERTWFLTDYLQGRARLELNDALARIIDLEQESKIDDRQCLVLLVMMFFAHDKYTEEEEATKTT